MLGLFLGILFGLFYMDNSLEAVTGITTAYCAYYCVHLLLSARLAKLI